MKLFLDANVLVSVLNKEYPSYTHSVRILSLADKRRNTLVTTSVALAIAFYFAEKKHGRVLAKSKIDLLIRNVVVADCGEMETMLAIQNNKVNDFEDGLQYYAALHSDCNCIITNDVDDFYFSEVEVLNPETFFRKYA